MKFCVLIAIPLAWALVFIVSDLLMQGTAGYRIFLRTEIELVKGLALIGCLAAALAFGRGEYLRRAWLFMGGCMFFLLLRDLTMAPAIEAALPSVDLIRGILDVAGPVLLAWKFFDAMVPEHPVHQCIEQAGSLERRGRIVNPVDLIAARAVSV